MTRVEIEQILGGVRANHSSRNAAQLSNSLAHLKRLAVEAGDQAEAKGIWCLEQALEAQEKYLAAFASMKSGKFYAGWCAMERTETPIYWLQPHLPWRPERFELEFIRTTVKKLQSIFPYKYFVSPEFLEGKKTCSICDKTVSIRTSCGHQVGEIYNGEMCERKVHGLEVLGMALVTSPAQKYSVPFSTDPATGEQKDHYNYSLVQYLIRRLESPFDDWTVEWTKRRHPHSRYNFVGRNEKCPCESDKKYKKCCLPEAGVLRPHVQFGFKKPLPAELATIEYSN